jgi:hypothetical protein
MPNSCNDNLPLRYFHQNRRCDATIQSHDTFLLYNLAKAVQYAIVSLTTYRFSMLKLYPRLHNIKRVPIFSAIRISSLSQYTDPYAHHQNLTRSIVSQNSPNISKSIVSSYFRYPRHRASRKLIPERQCLLTRSTLRRHFCFFASTHTHTLASFAP